MGCTQSFQFFNNQSSTEISAALEPFDPQKQSLRQALLPSQQDLSLTDYEAFLKQSEEQGRTTYPTSFLHIKIKKIPNNEFQLLKPEQIDPLKCTRSQLITIATKILVSNTYSRSQLQQKNIQQLIQKIAGNYKNISYHNYSHAFALMQQLYRCLLCDQMMRSLYHDQEVFFYFVAGLGHDLAHNGTNNGYETKLNTELAKFANNQSVLEKMHLRTLFAIMQSKPEFDLLSKSSNPLLMKQKVARAILSTDMAKHFFNLDKLKKIRNDPKSDLKDEELKIQIMENIIHACDISNSLLGVEQFMNWGGLLTYEFNQQIKLEQKNNLPVTQFLRFKGNRSYFSDQIGFLNTFVIPLWKEISDIFVGIKPMLNNCDLNMNHLHALIQEQDSKANNQN